MELPQEDVESVEEVALLDYVRVLRERWWVVTAAVIVAVALALGISLCSTPQYEASTRLLYAKNNLDQALFGSQIFSTYDQNRAVQTGAELVELQPVADAVVTQLGSSRSTTALMDMVSVEADSTTNVIDILAVSANPAEAAEVANAFAEQFVLARQADDRESVGAARELVKAELDSLSSEDANSAYGLMLKEKYESLRILESMQNGGFRIVERAVAPRSPFSPQPVRNAILALVIGLVAGIGGAFLLDRLDRRIKDENSLEREMGVPVLATVPAVNGGWGGGNGKKSEAKHQAGDAVGFSEHHALLESFRTLRSNMQYFALDSGSQVWVVTSGLSQEGKSTTAANLALSLALSGKRVIVLEADLRRPVLHDYLHVKQSPGLSNVLAGTTNLGDALQVVKPDEFLPSESRRQKGTERRGLLQKNLYVVTSGPLPPNPAELLASARMIKVVEELRDMADYLLIDSPPLLLVSDALVLASQADGLILTARLGVSTRDEARNLRTILSRAGVRVIGVVAGGAKQSRRYYRNRYGYGYGYGHGYGHGGQGELESEQAQAGERRSAHRGGSRRNTRDG